MAMDVVLIYAISWCGLFLLFIAISLAIRYQTLANSVLLHPVKVLLSRQVVRRHKLIGPITILSLVAHIGYIALHIFCLTFRARSVQEFALRAGNMALLSLFPLGFNFSLKFSFDSLGISLATGLSIHRVSGWMCCILVLCHSVAFLVTAGSPSVFGDLYTTLGAASLLLLAILLFPALQRRCYEFFFKAHQILAIAMIASILRHLLPTSSLQFQLAVGYLAASLGIIVARLGLMTFRNKRMGRRFTRVFIRQAHGLVHVEVRLPRPLQVDAGQYVLVWIPSIAFWSFLQIHPFSVASWSSVAKDKLDIVIQPRRGITSTIKNLSLEGSTTSEVSSGQERLAFVSGPYGRTVPVWDYRGVLLVANDFGIVALLSYLTKLVHGYRHRKGCTRRVHLVWHTRALDHIHSLLKFLNHNLEEDQSYMFTISIFFEQEIINPPTGHRISIYNQAPDINRLIGEVTRRNFWKPVVRKVPSAVGNWDEDQNEEEDESAMLILVSGSGKLRDEIRKHAQPYLGKDIVLKELDFQPE